MAEKSVERRNRRRGNGEGLIVHDKARNRWRGAVTVGFDEDGRQIRKWVTGKTRAVVAQRLQELHTAVDAGLDPAPRSLTVAKVLQQWLDDVRPGTVSPATERQYRDVVRAYIVPSIGQKRLRTLQARDVSRMLQGLEADGYAPNTRRLTRSVLRRAIRWAETEGMVGRNVAALAPGVKVPRAEGRALTAEQARTLLEHVHGHPLEAAFVVALALGLRRGELLGLAWDDIDFDAGRLTVHRNLTRLPHQGLTLADTKTAGSRRTLHLPVIVIEALRAHRTRQLAERLQIGPAWPERPLGQDLVFRSPVGTALDGANFYHAVIEATEEAGVGRWTPHQLRHSAASLLVAQQIPLKLLSETLGHSRIAMTADTYSHLYENAGAVVATAMDAILATRAQ
jgi:integrase